MDIDTINLVKASLIFSSLDENAYQKILPKFEKIELKKNEILFSQGDTSRFLYIVLSGKIAISLTPAHTPHKILSFVEPGQTLGEAGLLSNEPNPFTAIGAKDSTLLRLSKKTFLKISHKYPSVLFSVIEHTQQTLQLLAIQKINKHIAIIPANSEVNLEGFSNALAKYVKKLSTLVLISDFELDTQNKKTTQSELESLINEIDKSKKPVRRLIYILKSPTSPLAKVCQNKITSFYVIANQDSPTQIDDDVLAKIKKQKTKLCSSPNLILLHPRNTPLPKNTKNWLALMDFNLHHHVRESNRFDHLRLLRFIRGKAIGVVLGGGGTRGWAHLGVLKAIKEAKIPIDIIGGTSVGSIVGACYAIDPSYDKMSERFSNIVHGSGKTVSLRNITWPAISLFDGKDFTFAQQRAFDKIEIEDLWIPYFCISSNYTLHKQEIHRKGLLWERTRCSSSIPGLIPPMIINHQMHFDGGLINNLPIDIMRQIVGKHGKIIAVELIRDDIIEKTCRFPPVLTFGDVILSKIHRKYKFPPLLDTFLKALLLGSTLKAMQNAVLANLFININLAKFSILYSSDKKAKQMIKIGYDFARKQIEKSQILVRSIQR